MKTKRDYANSPAPAFDAVQDVMNYFGDRWQSVTELMGRIKSPSDFQFYAAFGGVEGFPVEAWYEHYNGGGSWAKALEEWKCKVCDGSGEVYSRKPFYDAVTKEQLDLGDFVGCQACNGTGFRA